MKELDEQERLILRHLIRDPRESDNGIGEATGVNVRTVGRKRQRLEQAGILSYFAHLDLSSRGTGQSKNNTTNSHRSSEGITATTASRVTSLPSEPSHER